MRRQRVGGEAAEEHARGHGDPQKAAVLVASAFPGGMPDDVAVVTVRSHVEGEAIPVCEFRDAPAPERIAGLARPREAVRS